MRYYLDLLLERSPAQRILLLLGAALVLGALDYVLVYRPQASRIARAAAQLELTGLDDARLRRELARLPQLRGELAGLRRETRFRLPGAADPSVLLEGVTARAAMAGLEVIRIHPGAAVEGEHFTRIPLKVELEGSFHDLLRFLQRPAASQRLPSPRDLDIEALGVRDGRTVLRIGLEMATLRVPDAGEAVGSAARADQEQAAGMVDPAAPVPANVGPLPSRDPFQPYQAAPQPDPEGPVPETAPGPPPETRPAPRFRAVGVVWQRWMAVALLRDGEGYGHVVQPGSRLDGRRILVKAVTPCEVILETATTGAEPGETRLTVPRCRLPAVTGAPSGG